MPQSHRTQKSTLICMIAFMTNACHPQFRHQTQTSSQHLLVDAIDQAQLPINKNTVGNQKQAIPSQGQKIRAVSDQTFNVNATAGKVWNAAINVLMKNYNLTILDRSNGVMTTEWDSFYLNGKILRNKISLRISPLPYNQAQITIINNMEAAIGEADAERNSVPWAPSEDLAGEAARVISSIASTLKIAPPKFPPKMAKYYRAPKTSDSKKKKT